MEDKIVGKVAPEAVVRGSVGYESRGGGGSDITITDKDEKTVEFLDPKGIYDVVKTSFIDTVSTLVLNEDAREVEFLTTEDIPSIVQQVINQIPNAESEMF